MKKVFFFEFPQDIEQFLEKVELDDIVIALRPEACFELDVRNIKYKCLQLDYYNHKEFMSITFAYKGQLKTMLKFLDDRLSDIYPICKNINIRPFERFIYFFRLPIDILKCEIFELDSFFKIENISKIKIFKHKRKSLSHDFSFSDEESIYEQIIYSMKARYNYDIEVIEASIEKEEIKISNNSLRKVPILMQNAKRLLKNYFLKKHALLKKGNILSVHCSELSYIKDDLIKLGWNITDFPEHMLNRKNTPAIKDNRIFDTLFKDKEARDLFEYMGIDFYWIVKDRFEYFCQRLDEIIHIYNILLDYMNNNQFDVVFFNSHTSFKPEDVILPAICKEKHIPYACWMHGGYGANYSVQGYDVSDFMFGQHYFVYGEEIKKLIDTNYGDYNLITHIAGSPKLLSTYNKYAPVNMIKRLSR